MSRETFPEDEEYGTWLLCSPCDDNFTYLRLWEELLLIISQEIRSNIRWVYWKRLLWIRIALLRAVFSLPAVIPII